MAEPDWRELLGDVLLAADHAQVRAAARYQREHWNPRRVAIIMGLLVKAVRTSRAIRTLVDTGLSNEAHMLARPLLEATVNLRVLERDSDGMLAERLYFFGLRKLSPKAAHVPWLKTAVEEHLVL